MASTGSSSVQVTVRLRPINDKGALLPALFVILFYFSIRTVVITTSRNHRIISLTSSLPFNTTTQPQPQPHKHTTTTEKKHGTLPVVTASTGDKTVTVIKGKGARQVRQQFSFDNVFTSFSTQEEVFDETLKPVIR